MKPWERTMLLTCFCVLCFIMGGILRDFLPGIFVDHAAAEEDSLAMKALIRYGDSCIPTGIQQITTRHFLIVSDCVFVTSGGNRVLVKGLTFAGKRAIVDIEKEFNMKMPQLPALRGRNKLPEDFEGGEQEKTNEEGK